MTYDVIVSAEVMAKVTNKFEEGRSALGTPDWYDFVSGPLAAAVFAFRDFDRLTFDVIPAVRSYTIPDPFFGAVVFVGVLIDTTVVEIADFEDDPDYWSQLAADPDE